MKKKNKLNVYKYRIDNDLRIAQLAEKKCANNLSNPIEYECIRLI